MDNNIIIDIIKRSCLELTSHYSVLLDQDRRRREWQEKDPVTTI